MAFFLKKGDLEPDLQLQLQDTARNPFNLTGYVSIQIRFEAEGFPVVSRAMTVPDPVNGKIVYAWQVGDTDIVGVYTAEVVVTWAGGEKQTFPASGTFSWTVEDIIT